MRQTDIHLSRYAEETHVNREEQQQKQEQGEQEEKRLEDSGTEIRQRRRIIGRRGRGRRLGGK